MTTKSVSPNVPPVSSNHGRNRRIGRRGSTTSLAMAVFLSCLIGLTAAAQTFTQQQLIEDARQLAQIIETSHPDPFLRCGGRIAFYRILDGILKAIPEGGMRRDDFVRLIRPLVAAVQDSHTEIWTSYEVGAHYPGGVPLRFGVVEESVYVKATRPEHEHLRGARLISVEGRSLAELMTKQRTLVGLENDYEVLQRLAEQTLWYEPYLAELLPGWTDHSRIRVELELPTGGIEPITFELPVLTLFVREPASAIEIPDANDAGFHAGMLELPGRGETIGFIRIDHQAGFREFLEENAAAGANDTTPEQRASVPSATEEFRDLAVAMEDAGTETLVVDLRFDTGGTDTMADILVYFLYGWEGLRVYLGERHIAGGFSAMRYSELHFENCSNQTIESVNEDEDGIPFEVGEYDFDLPEGTKEERGAQVDAADVQMQMVHSHAGAATFHAELTTGEFAGYYVPPSVVVLISPKTFSAGSTMMRALDLAGATLVGTPSGQSMRAFGNGTLWELDHSGIDGIIARSYFDPYPDDPPRGEVWPIAVPLSYEYLESTGFDPNAELLLALEWIEAQEAAAEAERLARLESKIESLREALKIPGISAAIVRDQALIWSRGFGFADVEQGIEATPSTPYGLASVTKPFAAVLLMKLVENGLLDLDTPIGTFGTDLGNPEITVRHLLSHTSGNEPGDEPGGRYSYSGDRYSHLTAVIAQLYGNSFRTVLRDEILGPLGMNDSALNVGGCGMAHFLSHLAPDDPERAFEHVYREAAIPYRYDWDYSVYPGAVPSYANAAAGLISTVEDLAEFALAIDRDELLRPETTAQMFEPTRLNSGDLGPYALGWFVEEVDGTELIWHYGYGAYSSLLLMVPSEGLTFIILANTQNMSRPFGLGGADVSVLASPFAKAFFKEFVLQPRYDEPLPEIDWTAESAVIIEQLNEIEEPALLALYEKELWTYRKLYAGVGEHRAVSRLMQAHVEAFPDVIPENHDLYTVGRPARHPLARTSLVLSDEQAARWIGRYALRAEDAATGLPPEMEIFLEGNRILASATTDDCQQFLAITPLRLGSVSNSELFLLIEDGEGPASSGGVEHGGTIIGTYDRVLESGETEEPSGGDGPLTLEQMREDLAVLRMSLETAHPGLYRYVDKATIDRRFDDVYAGLTDEPDEAAFYRLLSELVVGIQCGHTWTLPAGALMRPAGERTAFPLEIEIIDGRAYAKHARPENGIERGAEILSANGREMSELIEELLAHVSRDGAIETGPIYRLEMLFPQYYDQLIERVEMFELSVRNPGAVETSVSLPAVEARNVFDVMGERDRDSTRFEILEADGIAVMTIGSFSDYNVPQFLFETFRELEEKAVESLILDLRGNLGGHDAYGAFLMAHLVREEFEYYSHRSVTSIEPPLAVAPYSQLSEEDLREIWNQVAIFYPGEGPRFLPNDTLDRPQTPRDWVFEGDVIVLIDGGSFSATAEFAAIAHHLRRVRFVGEESGGAYYGNTSGAALHLTLPNSGIHITVPMIGYHLAVSGYPHVDRGVLPDHAVKMTVQNLIDGLDSQMAFALSLARGEVP